MNRVKASRVVVVAMVALCASYVMAEPTPGSPPPDPHSTAYLGVHIDDLTPQMAAMLRVNESNGAVIANVDQDGPACHAGLKENDVVVAFNGSKVSGSEQLGNLIRATAPGKVVTLTVIRGGARKDVKVTLGEWPHPMMRLHTYPTGEPLSLPGPVSERRIPIVPDVEMPAFIMATSRHGLMVESLSPQLAEFFGVQRGHGVLVRSVEKGSPADGAGLRAGDVITRVNNEQVQDIADWRRGMFANASKISLTVLRDKHEQTMVLTLPSPADGGSSQLQSQQFEQDMQAMRREIEKLEPQIAQAQQESLMASVPDQKDLDEWQRQVEKSTKQSQKDLMKLQHDLGKTVRPAAKDLRRMTRDLQKAAKPSEKDLGRLTRDIQKSMPSEKEMQAMTREIQKSMPKQKDLEEMTREIQRSIPSQQDLEQMTRDMRLSMPSEEEMQQMRRDMEASRQQVEDSMKSWRPQLQQEMEQLREQMKQENLNLQEMMKGGPEPRQEF